MSKPCAYFISLASAQPAGNCKFKSIPSIFAFQPFGNGISEKLLEIRLALVYAQEFSLNKPVTKSTPSGFTIGTIYSETLLNSSLAL